MSKRQTSSGKCLWNPSIPRIIFITGVSGYLGGHTVSIISEKFPEWQLVTLVRDKNKAAIVNKRWPKIQTVLGDLDDHGVLMQQGARADVVLQLASADHLEAANSIIKGMSEGKKGHYIHSSGNSMLHDVCNGYGNLSTKVYRDVTDIKELTSFNSSRIHRAVEASVIAAGTLYNIKTAIVSPAVVYGIGAGPINKRGIHIPFLVETILKRKKGFTVGAGKNVCGGVYIGDVSEAYIVLIIDALSHERKLACWGPEGYYFAQTTEHSWDDVSNAIVKELKKRGILLTTEIDELVPGEAAQTHPWAPMLWGGNCRCRPERMQALGWAPMGPTIYESLPDMIEAEITLSKVPKRPIFSTLV